MMRKRLASMPTVPGRPKPPLQPHLSGELAEDPREELAGIANKRQWRKQAYQDTLTQAVLEQEELQREGDTAGGQLQPEKEMPQPPPQAKQRALSGIRAVLFVAIVPALLLIFFGLWSHYLEHGPAFVKSLLGTSTSGQAKLPPPTRQESFRGYRFITQCQRQNLRQYRAGGPHLRRSKR